MILSVSRYVADKEEQQMQEELQTNDEKLQAAAQALVLQAREMVQAENDEQEPKDIDKDYTPVKRAKEENEV